MYVIFPVDKLLEIQVARLPETVYKLSDRATNNPQYCESENCQKRVKNTGDSRQSAGPEQVVHAIETDEPVQIISKPPTPVPRSKSKSLKYQPSEISVEGTSPKDNYYLAKRGYFSSISFGKNRKTLNSSDNLDKNKLKYCTELLSGSDTVNVQTDLPSELNTDLRPITESDSQKKTYIQSSPGNASQLNTSLYLETNTNLKSNLHQQQSNLQSKSTTDLKSQQTHKLQSQRKSSSFKLPVKTSFKLQSKTNLQRSTSELQSRQKSSLQSTSRNESDSHIKFKLDSSSNTNVQLPLGVELQSGSSNELEQLPKTELEATSSSDLEPIFGVVKRNTLPRPTAKKNLIPRDKIIRSASFIEQEAAVSRARQLIHERHKLSNNSNCIKITAGEKKEKHNPSSDTLTLAGINAKISDIVRPVRSRNKKRNLPSSDLKLNTETSQLFVFSEDTRKNPCNLVDNRSTLASAYNSATRAAFEVTDYQENKMSLESGLRCLSHPGHNESLKNYNSATFKLIKTISEFCGQLARLHERHSEDLQHLVEHFRKKHSELRNERPTCPNQMFQAWETLLQEVEIDSQLHSDVAGTFSKQVSKPLIERTFHKKIQSKKVLTHREGFDSLLTRTEELLRKSKKEYSDAVQVHYRTQNNASLAAYFDAHNSYVEQLHATNSMLKQYHNYSLPSILQELDDVYADISAIVIECILQGVETVSITASEQNRRYESLNFLCKGMEPRADTVFLVKYLDPSNVPPRPATQYRFVCPSPQANAEGPHNDANQEAQLIPPLKNELVMDQLAAVSSRSKLESLRKECGDLERQIICLQEGVDALVRVQQRSLESSLFHKANELQEDISVKKFDIRVAELHLASVKAQKELFASKDGNGSDSRDRKMSNSSTGTMKSKWMKAFKSLKSSGPGATSSSSTSKETERKPPRERERAVEPPPPLLENSHILQEYTYKKITACDVCQQILRGHSRQGLKCRLCKMNVHSECQDRVPRCQPKSRLLRRQRSTSEIESKQMFEGGEDDAEPVISYSSLIASQPMRRTKELPPLPFPSVSSSQPNLPPPKGGSGTPSSISTNPEPPQLSMYTLGLLATAPKSRFHFKAKSPFKNHLKSFTAPSSPVHNRRLLSARAMRMSSVELPDENEKSLSSASTSPCPSPINKKPHRLLPTNLYVVLYNFTSRHADELDLRAGYKITVIDTSDPDWWQGKCLGRIGYFPSKYVTRLHGGEKPLQVTHNLQVSDGENGIKLLRDQIVIQIGEEIDGMVMIRNGDKQQGVCPLKYLQEV